MFLEELHLRRMCGVAKLALKHVYVRCGEARPKTRVGTVWRSQVCNTVDAGGELLTFYYLKVTGLLN